MKTHQELHVEIGDMVLKIMRSLKRKYSKDQCPSEIFYILLKEVAFFYYSVAPSPSSAEKLFEMSIEDAKKDYLEMQS